MSSKSLMNGKGEKDSNNQEKDYGYTEDGRKIKRYIRMGNNEQAVPIAKGESENEAINAFEKSHKNEPNNEQKDKGGQISKKEENNENIPKLDKNTPPPDEEAEELKKIEEEKQRELEEKKRKRQEQFSNDIDEILQETNSAKLRGRYVQMTEDTPQFLQNLGLPNKPLYIKKDHVYTVILKNGILNKRGDNYHDMGKKFLMNLPSDLEDPLMVYKNNDVDNEIVVVLDKKDKAGWNIIVPITIGEEIAHKGVFVTVNRIKSAYGKEKEIESYVATRATPERILYKKQEEKKDENQAIQEEKIEQVTEEKKKELSKN